MRTTVILPSYRAARTLPAVLAALEPQVRDEPGRELVVVESGGEAELVAAARALGARARAAGSDAAGPRAQPGRGRGARRPRRVPRRGRDPGAGLARCARTRARAGPRRGRRPGRQRNTEERGRDGGLPAGVLGAAPGQTGAARPRGHVQPARPSGGARPRRRLPRGALAGRRHGADLPARVRRPPRTRVRRARPAPQPHRLPRVHAPPAEARPLLPQRLLDRRLPAPATRATRGSRRSRSACASARSACASCRTPREAGRAVLVLPLSTAGLAAWSTGLAESR